ncbi:MAG: 3-deoxy-7-phosphoheptulonate synthase [Planctomycetes bacterium]|nr:3-deoxy-7-phosphoheptulonate synthase [Planctomycetota bacterium]
MPAPDDALRRSGRAARPEGSVVRVGEDVAPVAFGGREVALIAGPCAVESREQVERAARAVVAAGAAVLRGGAFKGRTSPYAFPGLGAEGLDVLRDVGRALGVPVCSEVLDAEHVAAFRGKVDLLQVGARNMQNVALLRACGRSGLPVLLKRGLAATVEEWLLAAEYVMSEGNERVILCERGIRTFEPSTRATLDLAGVVVARERTHLPVIVDPSHAAGRRALVPALGRAALAAGADGLIVEVHPDPERALSDGPQALTPEDFEGLVADCRAIGQALGRPVLART